MLKLKPSFYELPEFRQLLTLINTGKPVRLRGIYGSFLAFVINFIREHHEKPQLIVLPEADEAEKLVDDLRAFMPESHAVYFPSAEVVPFDKGMFTPALYSMRMNALAAAVEQPAPVLVTTPPGLLRRVPMPQSFQRNIVRLKVGEDFERELLIEWLAESGYIRMPIIEEIGQFSVRGGILDVFSFESEVPCRIEFFGDTIESLREFDVLSQLSIDQVPQVRLLGKSPEDTDTATIFDYFSKNNILFWEDPARCKIALQNWWEDAAARFDTHGKDLGFTEPDQAYLNANEFETAVTKLQPLTHEHLGNRGQSDLDFQSTPPAAFHGNMKLLVDHLQRTLIKPPQNERREIWLLHDGKASRNRLEDILAAEVGFIPPMQFYDGELHDGFALPQHNLECLTDHEVFNRLRMRRKKRRLRVSGSLIRNLQTMEYGDYVVHIDYGVGKYVGTERIKVVGFEKECIKLLYLDDDVLYVTLDKLNRIQRYVSEEGFTPKLTKLGSAEWERVKSRTRKSVEGVARELVELYAKRLSQQGFAFSEDTLWQKEMEASFPFEDTPDQAKAAAEVKQDMEKIKPMDRLVCGDVGYGKTEIAVRAAFKAVMEGKQVAVLVPTTILAQQHFNTFSERVANFPVRVEVVSRFRSKKEQKEALDKLERGQVDIIIGTHRLLSKDVKFKELGLLVIDEEQRFGVTHKEKLKQLKINVDTLTLTATPIPRTLHMSLMGARDLSIVDTPPGNRLPIMTEITTWDSELVYKAITYEMNRGGQVFFVHNRVQSIDAVANTVKAIVPKARIAVAHGQMNEHELEDIMDRFYHKKYDVLIATMIIENGVDIPNCNTIIINRADRFGLAQLYQLRGRVGRSDRQAYAYLIIPPQERLSDTSLKRLYAIEEFGDLGSGLKIAMRDLEIRGAGNLLGHKQSGFINAVGYDLYRKILQEAVEAIQNETLPENFLEDRMPRVDASVEIDVEMYLPDDYIGAPNEKVIIYHRLVNLDEMTMIDNLVSELRDRFGPLPEPAERLVEMVKIKKLASRLFIKSVKVSKQKMILVFDERATAKDAFIEKQLPKYIDQTIAPLKFVQTEQLKAHVTLKGRDDNDRISFAKFFLQNI
ncbi:MAG: transcription-repair coupling factor [Calditrichae bacterium]|nr:transcription-repair coupling factor [Calditrichia bacterium]